MCVCVCVCVCLLACLVGEQLLLYMGKCEVCVCVCTRACVCLVGEQLLHLQRWDLQGEEIAELSTFKHQYYILQHILYIHLLKWCEKYSTKNACMCVFQPTCKRTLTNALCCLAVYYRDQGTWGTFLTALGMFCSFLSCFADLGADFNCICFVVFMHIFSSLAKTYSLLFSWTP